MVKAFCTCTPKGATKNNILKRHQERRLRLIFFTHSLSSSLFSHLVSGLFCFLSTFHRHFLQQQAVPFLSYYRSHPLFFPRGWKQQLCSGKPFMGWQLLFERRGSTSVPVADLFKSLLLWTTGKIRKQPYLIRCNRNWQVSKNRLSAHGFMCATYTSICVSFLFVAAK